MRFEAIEGDNERVRLIETFDLTHPRCPFVHYTDYKLPQGLIEVQRRINSGHELKARGFEKGRDDG